VLQVMIFFLITPLRGVTRKRPVPFTLSFPRRRESRTAGDGVAHILVCAEMDRFVNSRFAFGIDGGC